MTIKRIKNKLIRIFFHEQWSLLICDKSRKILKHIAPPKDRFWADPFPVEYNGKTYIFIEEQIGHGNGTLGYIELYEDLSYSSFTPILEKKYHLSFPHIFPLEENGIVNWYMIPESHENKTIDLYKANDFPNNWVFVTTMMDNVGANDSVVLFHDNYWYLFSSIGTKTTPANYNLSLFYSKTFPSSNWTPHPQNPICSDPCNSRMAGAFFADTETKNLFRPAQNCLHDYGKETNINKVIELSPTVYKEELIRTIKPEAEFNAVCTHTINYSDNYILRDIKTRIPKKFSEISLKH